MSRHECRQCGAPITAYAASQGGTYDACSATFGSGSHEVVVRRLRARNAVLLAALKKALGALPESEADLYDELAAIAAATEKGD